MSDDETRCPVCDATSESLEVDRETQRAFCVTCATEYPVADAIAAGSDPRRYSLRINGARPADSMFGDPAVARGGLREVVALDRLKELAERCPDLEVSLVLDRGGQK